MAIAYDDWEIAPPPGMVLLPPTGITGEKLAQFLTAEVMPYFSMERMRLNKLEMWGCGSQPMARACGNMGNLEKKVLQRFARSPWIPLMVSTFAQQLIVEGYRREGDTQNDDAWRTWEFNDMKSQQFAINRATIISGYSYVRVTDGTGPDGNAMAVVRGVDPQNAFGIYEDPCAEFPTYLLERKFDGGYRWWTQDSYTDLKWDGYNGFPSGYAPGTLPAQGSFSVVKETPHAYGVVPFIRYVNQMDLKGRCWGDVEPVILIAARMDKTVLDRLLVQHYNSFKIRWGTGLEQPDTEEGAVAERWQLQNGDFLFTSNEQAKFGTLDETMMDPFVAAYRSDLETFIATSQLPPDLAGQVANIAADALEGARRSSYQKLYEKQAMLGQSHARVLRLAAHLEGREEDATDFSARVHWQDVQIKSLAQAADALGKICTQLGVPKQGVWDMIPGVDPARIKEWEENYFDDSGPDGRLNKFLREMNVTPSGMTPGRGGTNSTANQAPVNENPPTP